MSRVYAILSEQVFPFVCLRSCTPLSPVDLHQLRFRKPYLPEMEDLVYAGSPCPNLVVPESVTIFRRRHRNIFMSQIWRESVRPIGTDFSFVAPSTVMYRPWKRTSYPVPPPSPCTRYPPPSDILWVFSCRHIRVRPPPPPSIRLRVRNK